MSRHEKTVHKGFHDALGDAEFKEKTEAQRMVMFHNKMVEKYQIQDFELDRANVKGIRWDDLKVEHLIVNGHWTNLIVPADRQFKGTRVS